MVKGTLLFDPPHRLGDMERERVFFRNLASMSNVIIANIRRNVALWATRGAKHLGSVMPESNFFCNL